MAWTFAPEFDAAARAALSAGKPVVYCAPPAAWAVRPLLERLGETDATAPGTLILVPERLLAVDLVGEASGVPGLQPARVATSSERTGQLLQSGRIRTLVGTPSTALRLLGRSALQPSMFGRVVVCWPESYAAADAAADLEALLGEVRAQRIVVTGSLVDAGDFLERYAHRAPAVMAAAPPEQPGPAVRYAIVAPNAVVRAVESALDRLQPASALVWDPVRERPQGWIGLNAAEATAVSASIPSDPVALAIATDLPSAGALAALRAAGTDVLILVRPSQLTYLKTLARAVTPLSVTSEADRARDWQERLRDAVRQRIEARGCEENLLALAPLFEEFDPALVAAALMDVTGGPAKAAPTATDVPLWAHLHLNVGRRDGVRAGDVVGATLNAAGLPKEHVGRVDIRENFTLVEVRAESAESARRGLVGVTLKGRQLTARFDRK